MNIAPLARFAVIALLVSAPLLSATPRAPDLPDLAQDDRLVILVRHAETDATGGQDPGLSAQGQARAEALRGALADTQLSAVVTSSLLRTVQTAAPTAEAHGLSASAVSVVHPAGLDGHLAGVLLAVQAAEPGGAVLVVGHSNTVPRLVELLGGPALPDLDHADYGQLFLLHARGDEAASLVRARYAPPAAAEEAPAPQAYDAHDPCPEAVFPDAASSPYVLPYPVGETHNVRQGNCNPTNTHNDNYRSAFAYDFEMPIGSEIVAARGGRVAHVEESHNDEQRGLDEGNFLVIQHDDGSYAIYGHMTHAGVLVEVGEQVETGQLVALSGNSGLSRGPHLHFMVSDCPEGVSLGGADCAAVPVSFRNTRAHPRGLVGSPSSAIGGGEWYEALAD